MGASCVFSYSRPVCPQAGTSPPPHRHPFHPCYLAGFSKCLGSSSPFPLVARRAIGLIFMHLGWWMLTGAWPPEGTQQRLGVLQGAQKVQGLQGALFPQISRRHPLYAFLMLIQGGWFEPPLDNVVWGPREETREIRWRRRDHPKVSWPCGARLRAVSQPRGTSKAPHACLLSM